MVIQYELRAAYETEKKESQKKRAVMSTCAILSVNVTSALYYYEYQNYYYISEH